MFKFYKRQSRQVVENALHELGIVHGRSEEIDRIHKSINEERYYNHFTQRIIKMIEEGKKKK